jgi:hypothetical protein
MVDLPQSTKIQQEEGKLMGIAKPIKNLKKLKKKNTWKLLHIPANTPTTNGNQSPLCNKLMMANENTLFLVLSSKKNGLYLLCSQTPSSV